MNNYFHNLFDRHTNPEQNIKPRTKARFEGYADSSLSWNQNESLHENQRNNFTELEERGVIRNSNAENYNQHDNFIRDNETSNASQNFPEKRQISIESISIQPSNNMDSFNTENPKEDSPAKSFLQPETTETSPNLLKKSDNNFRGTKGSLKEKKEDKKSQTVKPNIVSKRTSNDEQLVKSYFPKRVNNVIEKIEPTSQEHQSNQQSRSIQISIGRIEVKATPKSSPTTTRRKKIISKPKMSLEDYLNKQK